MRQLDTVSNTLASQNAQELDSYKKEVQSNPQLQEEMRKAANEYALANNQPTTYVADNSYDNYPYPYWSGYPTWYSSPLWYPQPLYYQTGYYIGAGGGIVIAGLPSRGYSNWFFNNGYRHYPLIYNHYKAYYNNNHTHFNANFYSGFHNEAHSHFSGTSPMNKSFYYGNSGNMNKQGGAMYNPMRNQQPQPIQQPQHNYNKPGFEHFNAGSFHQSGWNNVVGGARSSGGYRGGAVRSGGGNPGGGGAHTGGGKRR